MAGANYSAKLIDIGAPKVFVNMGQLRYSIAPLFLNKAEKIDQPINYEFDRYRVSNPKVNIILKELIAGKYMKTYHGDYRFL